MNRRSFVKNTTLASAAIGLAGSQLLANPQHTNVKFPARWKGFNLTDFNTPDPAKQRRYTTEDQLKWMRDWGFNFIRLPMAYPYYLKFDRSKPITPDEVYQVDESAMNKIDQLVQMAHKNDLHVSLNLHRAPGYCINAGFNEPYNLWKDEAAQQAFYFHWNIWAKRYKNLSSKKISFDLLNEPSMREDMNDQLSRSSGVPGDLYRKVAEGALKAIRKENKEHFVIADGNNVGNKPIPELFDLPIAQSCRGYNPGAISHYKAPWANKDPENMPVPVYPGQVGKQNLNRQMLEDYYKPWLDAVSKGVAVHCGECGSWNKTPHPVFLAWFTDVLDILSSNGIGFALWEYIGDFGILNSGRTDVVYEDWKGMQLDRGLLKLMQKY
ncbi:MAG: cellulase family glycosylhydrolase [Chitinophagaceae bacterium]